jgi:hypothetical protein
MAEELPTKLMQEIRQHLQRLNAGEVVVRFNGDFEPKAGTLVAIQCGGAEWHLEPRELLDLLKGLANGCGPERIKAEIEKSSIAVWHGPAPPSRDTSP